MGKIHICIYTYIEEREGQNRVGGSNRVLLLFHDMIIHVLTFTYIIYIVANFFLMKRSQSKKTFFIYGSLKYQENNFQQNEITHKTRYF